MKALEEARSLPVAERIQLVEDLSGFIAEDSAGLQLTGAQREELDRRLDDFDSNPAGAAVKHIIQCKPSAFRSSFAMLPENMGGCRLVLSASRPDWEQEFLRCAVDDCLSLMSRYRNSFRRCIASRGWPCCVDFLLVIYRPTPSSSQ